MATFGRGALDCKGSLISIMEAVNNLIRDVFKPQRTVYLLLGTTKNAVVHGAVSLPASSTRVASGWLSCLTKVVRSQEAHCQALTRQLP